MTKNSNHIYFDECTLFGLFSWPANLVVELSSEAEDGALYTQVRIAEDSVKNKRGILVEVAGKGRCFVTDTASVKAVKKYIRLALGDGQVDARESRVFRQMAMDLLDGKLDGKYQRTPINNAEYSRALRRLHVA